ncbi:MAG: T9SS type A sorting domain-containing protein [Bacteroidota bacterium]
MKKVLFTTIFIFLACIGFSVNTMFAPTLVAPLNNAVNQMPNAFLNWSAVPGAFNYKIQISPDSLFVTPTKYTTNLTAINSINLLFNTKYFWRVKAIGTNDSSAWSAYYVFYTINTVTIVKPGNGSLNRPVSAYFKWNAIAGIANYEYQMDTSLTFSSPLFVSSIIAANKIEAYSKQLAFNQHYYLRMRAKHAGDTSSWSALTDFWTLNNISTNIPVNNDTTKYTPITKLEWQWVGSKFYEYSISTDSLFTTSMSYTFDTTKVIKLTNDTIIRVNTDTLLFGQKYFWKVRAKNSLDTSNWSTVSAFNTLNKVKLISPANGATNVSVLPTLEWDSISNIGYYILEYDNNSAFTSPVSVVLPNTSNLHTISGLLSYGTFYYWRVKTLTLLDTSSWSNTFMFKTISGVGIENNNSNIYTVSIYPNPSLTGKINIQIESSNYEDVSISLLNMVGQEVYNQTLGVKSGENIFNLDLSTKENGIYFLKLQNGDNTLTRKIILNK